MPFLGLSDEELRRTFGGTGTQTGEKLPVDPISTQLAVINNNKALNDAEIARLRANQGQVQGAQEYADAYDRFAIKEAQGLNAGFNGALGANTQAGFANAQGANAAGQQLVGNYGNLMGGLNALDLQSLGAYEQGIAPYRTPIAAGSYNPYQSSSQDIANQNQALGNFNNIMNGGYDIRAAQYQSNPGDVQRQLAGYNDLTGVGNGSLDYQAAQYASNPADIGRQMESYGDLRGIATGTLDYLSKAQFAEADPNAIRQQTIALGQMQNVANGLSDVQSQAAQTYANAQTTGEQRSALDRLRGFATGENGEYAGMEQVRDRFKELSNPQITAQERLMMELAQREQESGERAGRGAVLSEQRARGFGGGGSELTSMLGLQEQLGQERVLANLGAQANAIQRSQQNLANWGTSEQQLNQSKMTAAGIYVDAMGNLRSQEFDEAFKRAASGDAMAVENANRRLQAMGMSASQANVMRSQSFDEAYKRGLAADQASRDNQGTRLQGAGMAASQANAIRAANDAVGTFNVGQQNVAQANNQQTRLAGKQSAAAQSNAIRNSNDMVGTFNVGEQNRIAMGNQQTRVQGAVGFANQTNAIRTANDAIGTFNAEQGRLQMNFATEQQSREAKRLTDLEGTLLGEKKDFTQGIERRAFDTTQFGLGENELASKRNDAALTRQQQNNNSSYQAGRDLIGDYSGYGQNSYNRALGTAQLGNQIGQTSINNNNTNTALQNQASRDKQAAEAFSAAQAALAGDQGGGVLSSVLKPLGLNGLSL